MESTAPSPGYIDKLIEKGSAPTDQPGRARKGDWTLNKGAFAYSKNHGWRSISVEERAEALQMLNCFTPKNKKEKRAKAILELFIRDRYSAQAIERLHHPDIISFGNRSYGNPLRSPAILSVIYEYFPQFRGRNRTGKGKEKSRVELMRKRDNTENPHIKACAFCGSVENLEEHHMIPLSMGGTNADENLIFLCYSCHKAVTAYQNKLRKTEVRT